MSSQSNSFRWGKKMKKALTFLAVFVTFVGCAMAADAAFDRGGTPMDKVLLVSISVIAVLGVHLMPALARNRAVAWFIWSGCLLGAIYGHVTFFMHSTLRAGEVRATQSMQTVGAERQIAATKEALSEITARPITEVTAQLSTETNSRVRSALRTEVAEGKRAELLRDELVRLEATRTSAVQSVSADPVTGAISSFTGWSAEKVMVGVGMFYALLVELVGAFLWVEALRQESSKTTVTASATQPSNVTKVATQASNEGATEAHPAPARVAENEAGTQPGTRPATLVIDPLDQEVSNVVELGVTRASNAVTDAATRSGNVVTLGTQNTTESDVAKIIQAVEDETCKGTVSCIQDLLNCSIKRATELQEAAVIRADQAKICKGTVKGIREFMGCSQSRAVELNKLLADAKNIMA